MIERIPTLCLNCSTVCGMIAKVQDGKVLKLEGNPLDPNSRGKLCAKGQAAITMLDDPDRLLFPMRRIGPRGSGKWERITWDEAITAIAEPLRRLRRAGHPERLMVQYGRDRTNGFLDRFTDAFGTPNKLGHRGLCSLNKRMAIKAALGDTDWDTADFERSRVILNFGSNFYEAHQGHIGMLQRVAAARRSGARLITFDVRLSRTAAQSDEWHPVFPGTDGLLALAIGHVLLEEGLYNRPFIEDWTNVTLAELRSHYERYSPEWAERECGVSATDVRRIARMFAEAAPHATTVSNRGTHAHVNGFHNEWAVLCLNALVGSIGEPGGLCYVGGDVNASAPQPGPLPPKPGRRTELSHPTDFPFANELYPRAVSSTIYPYLASGKARIDTLISYYVNAPMSWPQGPTLVRDVLLDEDIVPFHVAIDAFDSETVEVADYVLPDATFLEKWDLDARNSYDLRPYVGLRQPVVAPKGECRDIRDILTRLAREVDDDMAQWFPHSTAEAFVREWAESVPGGLDELRLKGIWVDGRAAPAFRPFLHPVEVDLQSAAVSIDDRGLVAILDEAGGSKAVGLLYRNVVVRGFATRDRRFQFKLERLAELGYAEGSVGCMPSYIPIAAHHLMGDEDLILTTFKWNVHTQSRTANQIWLTEIVGDNPVWINPVTARRRGVDEGDLILIERISPLAGRGTATLVARAHLTEAIHPRVIAISASFGHWRYGRTASGRGYNPNHLIDSEADPIGGGQAWNDTVVRIRREEVGAAVPARTVR